MQFGKFYSNLSQWRDYKQKNYKFSMPSAANCLNGCKGRDQNFATGFNKSGFSFKLLLCFATTYLFSLADIVSRRLKF